MTIDTITSKLIADGLFIIQVEDIVDKEDARGFVFVGDLDKFIKSIKALKQEVVFISARILEDTDFLYEFEDNNQDDEEETIIEPINLSSILPSIRSFEKYINKECAYKLSVMTENIILEFYIEEDWWVELNKSIQTAIEKIEDNSRQTRIKKLQEQISKEKDLLNQLRKLENDKDFIKLPTQKAMLMYAKDKIPELEDVDNYVLQGEIQNIKAKLMAKGVSYKR